MSRRIPIKTLERLRVIAKATGVLLPEVRREYWRFADDPAIEKIYPGDKVKQTDFVIQALDITLTHRMRS